MRAGDKLAAELGASANVMFSQIGIAVAGLLTIASLFSIFQPLLSGPPEEAIHHQWERERASQYEITASPDGRVLTVNGTFELGLTRALRQVMDENPSVTVLILNSEGGYVAQGRAVAKLIQARGFNTHVSETCKSACTIAFAAGGPPIHCQHRQAWLPSIQLRGDDRLSDGRQ